MSVYLGDEIDLISRNELYFFCAQKRYIVPRDSMVFISQCRNVFCNPAEIIGLVRRLAFHHSNEYIYFYNDDGTKFEAKSETMGIEIFNASKFGCSGRFLASKYNAFLTFYESRSAYGFWTFWASLDDNEIVDDVAKEFSAERASFAFEVDIDSGLVGFSRGAKIGSNVEN